MTTAALRQLPLADQHRALGARFAPFAGWDMPVQYAGIVEEHRAVRERAGVFDVSHMGRVFLAGKDAGRLLRRAVTYKVDQLAEGGPLGEVEVAHRIAGVVAGRRGAPLVEHLGLDARQRRVDGERALLRRVAVPAGPARQREHPGQRGPRRAPKAGSHQSPPPPLVCTPAHPR